MLRHTTRRLAANTSVLRGYVCATVAAREQAWFDKTLMDLMLSQTPNQVAPATQKKIENAAKFTEGPLVRCKKDFDAHLRARDPVSLFMAERRANNPGEDYLPEQYAILFDLLPKRVQKKYRSASR